VNSKEKTLFKKIEVFLGSKIFRIPLPGSMK